MNATEALDRLTTYTQADTDPVLVAAELDLLLADHAITADADDLPPTDVDWTPTYSRLGVWRAIAEGWALKAGKAADRFTFTTDGQNFQRAQVIAHCNAMADRYRRKAGVSTGTGGVDDVD